MAVEHHLLQHLRCERRHQAGAAITVPYSLEGLKENKNNETINRARFNERDHTSRRTTITAAVLNLFEDVNENNSLPGVCQR